MNNIHILNDRIPHVDPVQHVLELFEKTNNGELKITNYPDIEPPYDRTYKMNWSQNDAAEISKKVGSLIASLTRIGQLDRELGDDERLCKALSGDDLTIFNTYLRDFDEPFEVDDEYLTELYMRRDDGDLNDEENDILELHYEWYDKQSRKRLPVERCSPMHVINRAKRYERLVALNAPEIIRNNEARCLAEEIVIYYASEKEA